MARKASSTARFSASIGSPDLSGLLEKPVGDLAGAAAADRLDAGDRQEILDQRLGAGVVGAFQRRQNSGLGERALARPAEDGVETAPASDASAQAPPPGGRNGERSEHGLEQAGVAEPGGERAAARRRRRLEAQRDTSASAASASVRPKL